ncbi:hypothetical protein [Caminicella sporogenes]|nr:hypothetical protein [Caminicella sporogenes]
MKCSISIKSAIFTTHNNTRIIEGVEKLLNKASAIRYLFLNI